MYDCKCLSLGNVDAIVRFNDLSFLKATTKTFHFNSRQTTTTTAYITTNNNNNNNYIFLVCNNCILNVIQEFDSVKSAGLLKKTCS